MKIDSRHSAGLKRGDGLRTRSGHLGVFEPLRYCHTVDFVRCIARGPPLLLIAAPVLCRCRPTCPPPCRQELR